MITSFFSKHSVAKFFTIAAFGLSALNFGYAAPAGWVAVKPKPVLVPVSPGTPFPPRTVQASAPPSAGTVTAQAAVAYSGASATAITPELQALASGLNNDPVKIFNYVRNKIEYQIYYGCNKGAHLTYIEMTWGGQEGEERTT